MPLLCVHATSSSRLCSCSQTRPAQAPCAHGYVCPPCMQALKHFLLDLIQLGLTVVILQRVRLGRVVVVCVCVGWGGWVGWGGVGDAIEMQRASLVPHPTHYPARVPPGPHPIHPPPPARPPALPACRVSTGLSRASWDSSPSPGQAGAPGCCRWGWAPPPSPASTG